MTTRYAAVLCLVVAGLTGAEARAGDVVDVIPGLYGGDGITLGNPGFDATFNSATLQQLDLINQGLVEIPGNLPVGSSAASFTYAFNPVTGVPERQLDEGLGPLFVERARTLGGNLLKGEIRFALAFQYTHLRFERFEGAGLGSLELIAEHEDVPGDNDFERDLLRINLDVDAREDVYAFYGTLGILPSLDLSIVVPLVYVKVEADAKAEIIDRGGNGIHFFDPDPGRILVGGTRPTDGDVSRGEASAFGIGDVFLRAKWVFLETFAGDEPPLLSDRVDLALIGQVKFATGDDDDLLGTGHTDYRLVLAASKTLEGWFEPHVNLGYEWNGTRAKRDAFLWSAGAAVKIVDELTVFVDFLGKHKRIGEDFGDNLIDFVVGAKLNPFGSLILTPSLLVPLNEEGLRTRVAPSITVEYIF